MNIYIYNKHVYIFIYNIHSYFFLYTHIFNTYIYIDIYKYLYIYIYPICQKNKFQRRGHELVGTCRRWPRLGKTRPLEVLKVDRRCLP